MRRRRLLWQLYPSYVMIALLAVVGIGWFATQWFESVYQGTTRETLTAATDATDQRLGERITASPSAEERTALEAECRGIGQASGALVTVFTTHGEILCDSGGALQRMDEARTAYVAKALAGDAQSWIDGAEPRVSHLATPIVRARRVVAVVEASRSLESIDEALGSVRRRVALLGLAIAALAAMLGPLVARQVSKPIDELRKAAEQFARGKLGYKFPVPEAEELAGLANALNQMGRQLEERIDTIVRQNNEQQAVLGSMVEGVLAVDNEQRVISLNKASAQLLAIDAEQARGRSLQEVVRNADLRRFISRALTCDAPIEDDIVLHGYHQGVLQARGTALHDAEGRGIGAVVVLHDVTDFRRLEHIRRDFVANVSHELKTPITSIKGFVETLLDGAIQNPVDAERFLQIVGKQADRLNSIIEDLLSLSKIEQGEEAADIALEHGSVFEVLESAIHNSQVLAADRNIDVRMQCPETLAAMLNFPLFEEAVINLLDNAIKYSEPGKAVIVSAEDTSGEIQIKVEDHGVGIPAEHLPRIFERFYRVDKARSRKLGGTGLGLAIVKHIVQAHHGRVTVRSTPGHGTTFTIHLPAAERPILRAVMAG